MRATVALVFLLLVSAAGCGDDGRPVSDVRPTATRTATASATPEPVAAAEHNLACADVAARPRGPSFVVHGPLHNVGDVRLQLRVSVRWLLSGRDLRVHHTYRVAPGKRRRVRFEVPVSMDTLRRYESADQRCEAGVDIVGREGTVEVAP
jgi:hypothetical protein